MRPTFEHTVNVLVQAYLNDELAHKLCSACAVGNIVAAAIGTKPFRNPQTETTEFDCWFFDNRQTARWYDVVSGNLDDSDGLKQVAATGYSVSELRRIEEAFEKAPGDPSPDGPLYRGRCVDAEWMFHGLMAVVDVLSEIHGVDLSVKESAKLQFVKL